MTAGLAVVLTELSKAKDTQGYCYGIKTTQQQVRTEFSQSEGDDGGESILLSIS
jgi:hypothetical protein